MKIDSISNQQSDNRLIALNQWLDTIFPKTKFPNGYQLNALSGDASFRRYLRLLVDDKNHMVMDAPPEKEKVTEFIQIAEFLEKQQVRVPKIVAKDEANGFIVLEDFGDALLSQQIDQHTQQKNISGVALLYQQAMHQIIGFLNISKEDLLLPHYDATLLEREMALFDEWFLPSIGIDLTDDRLASKKTLWENTKKQVIDAVLAQPQGFVHRDFHSRNLMIIETGMPFGVIDFQDAVIGAYTYDLVSILRDVYVNWSIEQVTDWTTQFYEMLQTAGLNPENGSQSDFIRDFNMMGVQRHLKILGIFIRLYQRDGKTSYLPNLPQTMHYLLDECASLPELSDFNDWLTTDILPAFIEQSPEERQYLSSYIA